MSVSTLLAEHGIHLRSYATGSHKTTCPQCSHQRKDKKDPCLSVTVESNQSAVYKCHHCSFTGQAGGKIPASNANQKVYRRPVFQTSGKTSGEYPEEVLEWFTARGISVNTMRENRVHWKDGCILFPYTRQGETINIKYRTLDKRFRQEKDAEKIVFGLDDLIDQELGIIVEGEMDKLALWEAGYRNAVSVPDGAPAKIKDNPSEDDAKFEYLRNCEEVFTGLKRVVLAVDSDGPGQALQEELARRMGKERCWRVKWPDECKDANDVLMKHGREKLSDCIRQAEPFPISGVYSPHDFLDEIMDYYDHGSDMGKSTGWRNVDDLYRVFPGELTVVTAMPGSGKSEWIDALMVNLAKREGWKFALCSFENPRRIHAGKLAMKYFEMPLRPGYREHIDREAYENFCGQGGWLGQHFSWISAMDESPTFDWIMEKARALVYRRGIQGLVIDPYNEIEHKRGRDQSETEYVSQILSQVKRFAQNHGVHVWFVAHPAKLYANQKGEIPVPSLYDISGSAHWVNKTDNGIVIERNFDTKEVNVHVKKIRHKDAGGIGIATLRYDYVTGNYHD